MADGNMSRQPVQDFFVKHLRHKAEVAIMLNALSISHRNTGAFLSAVLQSKQTVIRGLRHVDGLILRVNAEHAAGFLHPVSAFLDFRHAASALHFILNLSVVCLNRRRHLLAVRQQLFGQNWVLDREHLRRQIGRVIAAADRDRRHRNASGHLHGGKQRIQPVHERRFDRNADDRQRRVSGDYASQMSRFARRSNDDLKAVFTRVGRERRNGFGRSVRAGDMHLNLNLELLEHIYAALEGRASRSLNP